MSRRLRKKNSEVQGRILSALFMSEILFMEKALDKSEQMFYNKITRNGTLVLKAILL